MNPHRSKREADGDTECRRRPPLMPSRCCPPQGRWTLGRRWKRYVAALDGECGNNGSAGCCDIAATRGGVQASDAGDGDVAALDAGVGGAVTGTDT